MFFFQILLFVSLLFLRVSLSVQWTIQQPGVAYFLAVHSGKLLFCILNQPLTYLLINVVASMLHNTRRHQFKIAICNDNVDLCLVVAALVLAFILDLCKISVTLEYSKLKLIISLVYGKIWIDIVTNLLFRSVRSVGY